MGVLSSKTTQILLPRIIINVPVTVQSDSQGQSEASSHWPSNIGWFMKSCLRTPGQLAAVGACERGPCRVSLCGRLPGLACLAENFNFFFFLKKFKPSWNIQAKHPGAGRSRMNTLIWDASQGDHRRQGPRPPLWSPGLCTPFLDFLPKALSVLCSGGGRGEEPLGRVWDG